MQILFEDNHLIAVNKKPGELAQGDKTGDNALNDLLKLYIKEKFKKPGDVFLGTIHRLDRPVSGVILYARTSKALERMNEAFREKAIQKTYWAIVKNAPPKTEDLLVNYLVKNEPKNKSYAYDKETKNSLRCELSYKVIARSDNYFLLELNPRTGRHHQIRVQLSHIGCPIKGDLKYGYNRSNPDGSICLHARQLAFVHPVKKESLIITADPPTEALWDYFKNLTYE